MRQQEAMAYLKFHWGDVYEFAIVSGRFIATARFGARDALSSDDPESLLRQIRRHYRRGHLVERCST